MSNRVLEPPFVCIFCGRSDVPFQSREHIVPDSLGNDLLVLSKGWVCDQCNNTLSGFESRVLFSSILGAERCRLGAVNKRGRPVRSETHGVAWTARPGSKNGVEIEAKWREIPAVVSEDQRRMRLFLPMHDDSNTDIARLLLKIGVEIVALRESEMQNRSDLSDAIAFLFGKDCRAWPYFLLRDRSALLYLNSIFALVPSMMWECRQRGFDIFLHEIDSRLTIFFCYGHFFAGTCLSTRDTEWRHILEEWNVPYIGCPIEFAHLYRD